MSNNTDADAPLFKPGKARWLKEQSHQELDDEQKALLLALTQLESATGRELSAEEKTALTVLEDQLETYNAQEITAAIHKMVNAPADPRRKTSWPKLKRDP